MSISINPSSVKIFIMPDKISAEQEIVTFRYITDCKCVPDGIVRFQLSNSSPAVKTGVQFGGHAEFSLGPKDTLAGWKVGFIQIVSDSGGITRYSGRTPTDGSIVCDSRVLPNDKSNPFIKRSSAVKSPSKPLLDCLNQSTIPWTNTKPHELFRGSASSGTVAAINTIDSPIVDVPLTMENSQVSKAYNFLYDFRREVEFWTILTAMDPSGACQYLGYCHWRIVQKVDFLWRSGAPYVINRSSFTRLDQDKGQFVPGPPPDADLQPILANPVGPIGNDIMPPAHAAAISGGGGERWRHSESDKGISPFVPNFWGGDLPPNVGPIYSG